MRDKIKDLEDLIHRAVDSTRFSSKQFHSNIEENTIRVAKKYIHEIIISHKVKETDEHEIICIFDKTDVANFLRKESSKLTDNKGMTDQEAIEVIVGIGKGLADYKVGNMQPWNEVKKELGL